MHHVLQLRGFPTVYAAQHGLLPHCECSNSALSSVRSPEAERHHSHWLLCQCPEEQSNVPIREVAPQMASTAVDTLLLQGDLGLDDAPICHLLCTRM